MSASLSRSAFRQFQALGVLAMVAVAGGQAQTTAVAPVLIPYTMNVLAGNPQVTGGGYSGDGGKAVGTTLNAPYAVAVDTVGNVYFADSSNAVIREINAQTGTVKIVAGIAPTGCTGSVCTTTHPGYLDGPAATTGVGTTVHGMAVDGYGNLFFSDTNQADVRVLYRGGAQVANFIATVNSKVTSAATVVPGNIYLVAGAPTSPTAGATGSVDKVLATQATFGKGNLQQLGLDGAGNIYLHDIANAVVRVINTQPTPQNFFGVTGLKPGFMAAIVNCINATLTAVCPTKGIGIGGPAAGASINGLSALGVDQYGNVYETTQNAATNMYGGVAYAGGAGNTRLASLLAIEGNPTPITAGSWYIALGENPATLPQLALNLSGSAEPQAFLTNVYDNYVLRSSGVTVDPNGNIYLLDYHYFTLYRTDVNSQVATGMNGSTASAGTTATPAPCGASTTTTILTNDKYGDGCPSLLATVSGYRGLATDGSGNVYIADTTYNLIREISVNNQFPSTAVGKPLIQTLQVHFDASNLPVTTTATTTSPLTIQSGNADFTIATAPVCVNNTLKLDASIDCTVAVTFKPTQPGLRTGSLQVSGVNGVTSFPLTGTGVGSALALDGGLQTTVGAVKLGLTSSVAVDAIGNVFITDQSNNQVIEMPAGGGAQTTVGKNLKAPQGVAVDAAGNVYIADTGNNQVVEVASQTGTLTTLLSGLAAPQGIAVDPSGNIFVADTGNARIVEIAANSASGVSVLRQFGALPGSDGLKKPVALTVDSAGNLYVADAGAGAVFKLPPGGGDLQAVAGPAATTPLVQVGSVTTPNGVAVDAAGNVYISDSTANTVTEVPSGSGPAAEQFTLSFTGLNAPAGLALDPQGNLYLADSTNNRVLEMNRNSLTVNFGSLPLFQAGTEPLKLSNIGNQLVTVNSPVGTLTQSAPYFTLSTDACSGTTLFQGLTCAMTAQFVPTALGNLTGQFAIPGLTANSGLTANLEGIGLPLQAQIAVAFNAAPVAGVSTASVTATVTQPKGPNTPTGTVTFTYTINEGDMTRGGSTGAMTVGLVSGSGGAATATLPLTGLLPARRYSIVATYTGDPLDTANTAAPFSFVVPGGTPLTVVSTPASFVYGSAVPALTGTVTGILPADAASVSYTFITPATPKTPVGSYPISLQLTGGNYLNYIVPPAVTASGGPAVVTETPAPLVVQANNFTSVYATADLTFTPGTVPGVNGETLNVHFTPASSSVLDAGVYPLVPNVTGQTVGNYALTLKNGTLTITQATPALSIGANAAAVLPTNLPSEQITIQVVSLAAHYGRSPGGTVTLTDTFTPLNATTANAPVAIGPLTLSALLGSATYTPTSNVFGTHSYTVVYNGDQDFQGVNVSPTATVLIDNPDFFPTAVSTPINVLPGILPGGNQNVPGESSANPEQATITLTPVLGYTGTITLSCASPSSYVTCTIAPASIILASATPQTAVVSVSTPATLPVNFTSSLRQPRNLDYKLAILPLGLLVLLPLSRSKRRSLARYIWVLLLGAGFSVGLSGCGSTLVKFYTPVPQGQQPLTITVTDGTISKTLTMTVTIQ